jgi:putative PIN family toxin of toxin-antitoxin system
VKVVFDTNIYISALVVPGRKAEEAYLRALRGDFTLCTSVAILTETAQKLREKFGWHESKIAFALKSIAKIATITRPKSHIHILADEPDNRILECAITAESDFIVTGDKHLLSLKTFRNIVILSLSDFLEMFETPSTLQ